jgi:EAL domain-containing protein (putative c-di-GMP-specific phosphodiesterase class I)
MLFGFARESHLSWDLEAISLENSFKRLRKEDLRGKKFLINLEAEMFGVDDARFHEMIDFFSEQRGSFVFELTERAAIEDYESFRKLLDEFRKKGIGIAIDDAGSGYASLEAIAALAPDYLKVTKALVSTVATEPIKQDVVKMLVDLAHKIGAETIAEGIETVEEWRSCRELGIDLMQGYFIAHPQLELAAGAREVEETAPSRIEEPARA